MSDVSTLKLQNNNVASTTNVAASTSASANASSPIEIVDKKTVEGQGNTDVAVTNNTSNTSNSGQRSVEELYNSIAALCTQYGISLVEAKKIGLLERIAGVSQEELLNFSNSEIQKQVECLKAALEKLAKNNGKIDIEEVIKLANDYNTALKTGWTIKGFQKANAANSEGICERMNRYFGKDFTKLSPEERVDLLDRYFGRHFEQLEKNGMKPETVAKLQLQDFGKLLINTPDEQKKIFKDAFASLLSRNRYSAAKALFGSFTSEEAKTDCADSMQVDTLKLAAREDQLGEKMSDEDMTGLASMIAKNQSEKGREETVQSLLEEHKNFVEENKEILERIAKKVENKEPLTEEEQAVLDKMEHFYTPVMSGQIIGTAGNEIISKAFKENLLAQINRETFDMPNYRKIMERVSEYMEKHPDACNMPKDKFNKLMDKVTNGNYSVVVEDAKNNTKTELNAPAPVETTVSTPAVQASDNTRTVVTSEDVEVSKARAQLIKEQIFQQNTANEKSAETKITSDKKESSSQIKDIKICLASGGKAFEEYKKSYGVFNTVKDVFNNLACASQGIVNKAVQMYSNFSTNVQEIMLKKVDNSGLSQLLKVTKDSTLLAVKDETFTNYYATQMVKEKAEAVEEKTQIV